MCDPLVITMIIFVFTFYNYSYIIIRFYIHNTLMPMQIGVKENRFKRLLKEIRSTRRCSATGV